LLFEWQGFFYGVILGQMVGIAFERRAIFMENFTAFLGYALLAMYYLMHLIRH